MTRPPLKVLLLCGPSATGKTFLTLRQLSLRYQVVTESMDDVYRLALSTAGIPFGARSEDEPERDSVSIYKAAHDLRTEGVFTPEAVAKFFSQLDCTIRELIELANTLGLGMVFEGYTLRFPDEALRVVAAAREITDDNFHLIRANLRPPKAVWQNHRVGWTEQRGLPRPSPVKEEAYERQMASPPTAEGVFDFVLEDEDELRKLVEDVLGLEKQEMSPRMLGLASRVHGGDTERGRSRIKAAERDRLIGQLFQALRDEREERRQREAINADNQALVRQQAELSHLLDERRAAVNRLEEERREVRKTLADRDRALEHMTEELKSGGDEGRRLRAQFELRAKELKASENERWQLQATLEGLREGLRDQERMIEELVDERAAVKDDVERAANSRSWRFGHGFSRLLRTLTFRRTKRAGALETALERLQGQLQPRGSGAAPPPTLSEVTDQDERPQKVPSAAEPERGQGPAPAIPAPRSKRRQGPPPAAGPISISETAEEVARQVFISRYERAVGGRDPMPPELAASSIPFPVDHKGILCRRNDNDRAPRSVDVVIPVHSGLAEIHGCLWSLLSKTGYPFHLILVNDGSDEETTEYLRDFAARNEPARLIHNEAPPHGYTLAANVGLRASESDYVVLLKASTVVTHGWLERIIACARSDQSLGVIGAVSGARDHRPAAAVRAKSLPDWLTPDTMAFVVNSLSERARPRVPFVNGSCCVIKRDVIDAIGVFDAERFAEGYSEDADFSYRAAQAGFQLAVADDAYVYDARSSYGDTDGRRPLAEAHQRALLSKHGEDEMRKLGAELEANQTLSRLDAAVGTLTADQSTFEDQARGILTQPLRVTFVLSGTSEWSSAVIESIHQEVRGMRALGIPARIGVPEKSWGRAEQSYEDVADVFFPFHDQEELADITADADVIVATDFKSVSMVEKLRQGRGDFLAAYYIQDYEPFFAETRSETPGEAEASFSAIEDQVLLASSHWICGLVGRLHGVHVNKVEPSIDRSLFRAARPEPGESDPVRVTAMIRPGAPHSQPLRTLRLLERLKDDLPDQVEVITFGCEPGEIGSGNGSGLDRFEHLGLVSRTDLPGALARSDIFLDCSLHQALGRTGLEAMACGSTAILPRLGGASEYAVDDVNALLVDTCDEDAIHRALAGLVTDRARLSRLQGSAADTAKRFSVTRAVLSQYALFEYEHNRLLGAAAKRPERRDSGSS